MSRHCDDALEQLYLYLDGELTVESAEVVRVHLDDCPPCLDMFSFERRLKTVVRTRLHEEVPAAFLRRLSALIQAESRDS